MRLPHPFKVVFVALVYFGLAVTSLEFSFHSSNASPIWPASGFAFAIILLWRPSVAYGILMGAFSANLYVFLKNDTCSLTTAIWVSLFIGIGNTLEALAGYYLLNKFLHGIKTQQLIKNVQSVYKFVLAALIMCLASCTMGSLSILIAEIISPSELLLVWFTWWTGDVSGILLVTPFILVLSRILKKNEEVHSATLPETIIHISAVILVSGMVFDNWFHPGYIFERAFVIIPFLIWASIRVDQKSLVILSFLSAVTALIGTLMVRGPFAGASLNESLITVEVFVSINSVMVLLLHAAIMERRRHEHYLNAARKNLESIVMERTKELHAKNQQLEKRNNELTMFSYSATHDLREPLRKIDFFSNRILESNSIIPEPERDLVKRIKATTQRMNQLMENLLSYSLLETHGKTFKQTDLNFVLSEVKHALEEDIQKTGAIIDSVELPVVNGVRSQFVQLFTNILDNSLKFRKSETAPRIIIEAELVSEVVCEGTIKTGQLYFHLTFRDNGIGFEKQYAGQVFEVLQKLHGQNEYEGTGIGLAICKKVVENHDGIICADAEPGVGTDIHIYLPVGPDQEEFGMDKKMLVDMLNR